MPPLQRTGVQLVVQDGTGFTAAMLKATQDVTSFGQAASRGAQQGLSPLNQAMQSATGVMESVSLKTVALGTALGNILYRGIETVVHGLQSFINTGIQAVSAIQDLQINLETLAAREILYSGATDDMNEALARGKPIAEAMMESLKNLSIQSPFEYRQIMEVFQMNMAFGQSSDMALELTRAITNLGAVNKGIPGILQRLSYNFSQMSMVGQITARDIRDLAMAGLDLKKVLQLQLGMSLQEVNTKLKSGQMTFKEVAQALVDYTDKYVGPAAQRASRTLGGLASTFRDVTFFTSANLLKPAAENVTAALGAMLDILLKVVDSQAFKIIGVMLEGLTSPLKNFGDWLSKVTEATKTTKDELALIPENIRYLQTALENSTPMEKFLTNMSNLAERMLDYGFEALEWGINIVTNLAEGIIQASSSVLVGAMTFVGNVLTAWLAPGSPPKIAPDLDAWGMSAMREYLLGFTEADFSVLKRIQQPLQQAMQYAVSAGKMTSTDMANLFAELSRDMVGVIKTGQGMEDILVRVGQAAGPFAQEVISIAKGQFELMAATRAAASAQERLTQAQRDYMMAGAKVSQGIREYNKLLKAGASKDVLKAKLAQINADRQAQQAAARGIVAAQDELKSASENVSALERSLALQQQMLAVMSELAKQTISAPEMEKRGGKGGATQPPSPTTTMPEIPPVDEIIKEKLDAVRAAIQEKMAGIFQPVIDLWNNTVQPAFERIGTTWSWLVDKFGLLNPKIEELKNQISGWWETIQKVWQIVMATLAPSWEALKNTLASANIDIKAVMDAVWSTIKTVIDAIGVIFVGLVGIITGVINGIIMGFQGFIQYLGDFAAFFAGALNGIVQFLTGIWAIIVGIFTGNTEKIREGVTTAFNGLLKFIANAGGSLITLVVATFHFILNFVRGFIDGVKTFFTKLWSDLVGHSIITDMLTDILDAFTGTFDDLINLVKDKIQGVVDSISGFVSKFVTAGKDLVGGLIDGITQTAADIAAAAGKAVDDAIAAAKKKLGIKSPSRVFMEIGANVTLGMAEGIEQEAGRVARTNRDVLSEMTAPIAPPRRGMMALAGATTNNTVSVSFGDVTITNQAEGNLFEARVERAVRKALSGI